MSTLPRDPTDATHAKAITTVLPARIELAQVVGEFEAVAERLAIARPSVPELHELSRQVACLTMELFPGEMEVEVRGDPEIPNDLYLVFEVRANGRIDDIVACDEQWHRRLLSISRNWPGLFRLSIDAR
jgi:hypothetical protein